MRLAGQSRPAGGREMTRETFAEHLRDGFDGVAGTWVDDTESRPDYRS